MRQRELREALPTSPGGRALLDLRGADYLRELGRRGGRTTRDRYGLAHMQQLAKIGAAARWWRPKTYERWDGIVVRRVCVWTRRCRRRPKKIYIEVEQCHS
jgi:hypothetical protein